MLALRLRLLGGRQNTVHRSRFPRMRENESTDGRNTKIVERTGFGAQRRTHHHSRHGGVINITLHG